MLEVYLNIGDNFFLSWENISGGNEYSFSSTMQKNIHGSKHLHSKARKLLNYSLDDVIGLNAFGKVTGLDNDLPPLYYIKHRGSGLRATFFKYQEGVFIGILAFAKQGNDHENDMFQYSGQIQETVINWVQENEELYKKIIQAD